MSSNTMVALFLWANFFFLNICACNGQGPKSIEKVADPKSQIESPPPYRDPHFFLEGQLCQHLREIFQDSEGHLWFGTNVYDIMMYDGEQLRYFNEKEGVDMGRITSIIEDKEGHIWFSTSEGLLKYNGLTFEAFALQGKWNPIELWDIYIDKNGTFWVGSGAGVFQFDGKEFIPFPIPRPKVKEVNPVFDADRITSIAEDNAGNLWFGTDGFGLCRYNGNSFENFTVSEGLCDNSISEIMPDGQGNIWIGTYFGGISKYDGSRFHNYTLEGRTEGIEIDGLYEDENGDIWFAAEHNGVYRYDGMNFYNLHKKEGLSTSGILSIYQDREKRFWFGGWGGLFRYKNKSFISVTKDGPWE